MFWKIAILFTVAPLLFVGLALVFGKGTLLLLDKNWLGLIAFTIVGLGFASIFKLAEWCTN